MTKQTVKLAILILKTPNKNLSPNEGQQSSSPVRTVHISVQVAGYKL